MYSRMEATAEGEEVVEGKGLAAGTSTSRIILQNDKTTQIQYASDRVKCRTSEYKERRLVAYVGSNTYVWI